jgi:hypothetical protein
MSHNSFREHSAEQANLGSIGFGAAAQPFREENTMSIPVKKIVIGAVVALSLGSAYSTPAAAWCNGWGCGGYDNGGAAAAGLIGGLALGAAIANSQQPHYYYAQPAYGGCWFERRAVYDQWGNFIGRRRVRICQ